MGKSSVPENRLYLASLPCLFPQRIPPPCPVGTLTLRALAVGLPKKLKASRCVSAGRTCSQLVTRNQEVRTYNNRNADLCGDGRIPAMG